MRLLEYEAKTLLAQAGIRVPRSKLITSPSASVDLAFPVILKVQIPMGGRGKAGGIRRAESINMFYEEAKYLFAQPILGYTASSLLIEECLDIAQELYVSLALDSLSQNIVLLAHSNGGMEIESTGSHKCELLKLVITNQPDETTAIELLKHFSLMPTFKTELTVLLTLLWKCFVSNDAQLLEINPLVVTKQKQLVCADAKMELDDAASFRHKEWNFKDQAHESQFVLLSKHGTIASMANGAGLAMATVDAISAAGAAPANFLDIGGGTNSQAMVNAFGNINELPSVKAIVINIFAGITRCDEVAHAIVEAKQRYIDLPPLFIRLAGNNAVIGTNILKQHGIETLETLQACVTSALYKAQNV